jgi:hypothetical protein
MKRMAVFVCATGLVFAMGADRPPTHREQLETPKAKAAKGAG